ncbi:MAG TPA: hypothetical protein VNI60_05960 [Pyrinomonadaceae bacterium]|nr:hypothetical protein [Pyrinomonadaceae bacterium]
MKKVLVIGSCGAGKSTFARRLGKATGLKIVHLDQLYWNAKENVPTWQQAATKDSIGILSNGLGITRRARNRKSNLCSKTVKIN